MATIGSSRASTRLGPSRKSPRCSAPDADGTVVSADIDLPQSTTPPPTSAHEPGRKIHATRLPARPTFCHAELLSCRPSAALTQRSLALTALNPLWWQWRQSRPSRSTHMSCVRLAHGRLPCVCLCAHTATGLRISIIFASAPVVCVCVWTSVQRIIQ